jgi:hypothetical protein
MDKTLLVRKLVKKIAEEIKLKSSNHYPSDADWYIGFGADVNTANESEYDPVTGKLMHSTAIGDYPTFLQQWDEVPGGYIEEEDEERDSGGGIARIVMQQITPLK